MNVNKNSWHYKVWKHFTSNRNSEFDGTANFCEYTRTIFLKAPVCCLAVAGLWTFMLVLQLLVAIPAIIFGRYPNYRMLALPQSEPAFFLRYDGLQIPRKLPHLPFKLYPWHVLLPIVLMIGQWAIIHYNGWFVPGIIEGGVFTVIAVCFGAAFLYEKGDSETVRLLKAKAEAKHRMICPLITFTDEPTSTNPEE